MLDNDRAVYLIERIGSLGVVFASGVLVIRALGAEGFAVYASVVGLGQLASSFGKLSLDEFLANRFASGQWGRRTELGVVVQRGLVGLGAAVLLWSTTPSLVADTVHALPLLGIAALASVEALSFQEVKIQALGGFRRLSLLGILRGALGLTARVFLLTSDIATVWTMLAVAIVELLVFRVGTYLLQPSYKAPCGRFTLPDMSAILSFGALTVLTLAYSRLDFFIGLHVYDAADFGTYIAAQRFLEPFAFLSNVLGALLMPQVATLPSNQAFAFAVRTSLRMAMLGAVLCVVNVLAVAHVLPWLSGDSYPGIETYFALLAVGLVPLYAGLPLGRVALAQGQPRIMVMGGLASVLTILLCFFVVLTHLSITYRLPVSVVVGNSVGCALVFWVMRKRSMRIARDEPPPIGP